MDDTYRGARLTTPLQWQPIANKNTIEFMGRQIHYGSWPEYVHTLEVIVLEQGRRIDALERTLAALSDTEGAIDG